MFQLPRWVLKRARFDEWLISEVSELYRVPADLARYWIGSEQVVPLLDGLDEVAKEHRAVCVEAINDFRRGYGLVPIAICSRTEDYISLSVRLRLNAAVIVQLLQKPQVEQYIARVGEPLHGLAAALEEDDGLLWEILQTPLMLGVAMLAYRDASITGEQPASVDEQRTRLFARFVEAMYERRPATAGFYP